MKQRIGLVLIAMMGVAAPLAAQTTLYEKVHQVLCAVRSSDTRAYWVMRISEDPHGQTTAWPYWVHRMEIGDGVGQAPPCDVPPLPPAPLPSIDLSPVLNQLSTIEGKLDGLIADEAEFHRRVGIAWGQITGFATRYLVPVITAFLVGRQL